MRELDFVNHGRSKVPRGGTESEKAQSYNHERGENLPVHLVECLGFLDRIEISAFARDGRARFIILLVLGFLIDLNFDAVFFSSAWSTRVPRNA